MNTPDDPEGAARRRMVEEQLAARDITDERVLDAMGTVPRHLFVQPRHQSQAYADHPLPIVGGQTISQPYIVAFMSQAAELTADSKCLEIGTGSGYQAAVLAQLCAEVYSIEYLPEVAEFGAQNLAGAGAAARTVQLRLGDGYQGWPEAAPFDAIIVTAAPEHVPQSLLDQLAVGGRLVIPVGPASGIQRMEVHRRVAAGSEADAFDERTLFSVRFVPFLGDDAN